MKRIRKIAFSLAITATIYICICLALIFWPIPSKKNIESFDFSSLEKATGQELAAEEQWLTLRDKSQLFYRHYASAANSTLILLHGSSGESSYLGDLAKFMAESGIARVITPDLRGHGRTANQAAVRKGDIAYIGQYDDDLEDLIHHLRATYPNSPIILGGHSSGGGLAVRYAGNSRTSPVDGYLLFAPFLGHEAITMKDNQDKHQATAVKSDSGDWVTVALKRWIGLAMINDIGITAFNHKPVLMFNLPERLVSDLQTADYSYRLAMSFQPNNYIADIKHIDKPTLVVVGQADETFVSDQYSPAFKPAGKFAQVKIIPAAKHMDIINHPDSRQEILNWYRQTFPQSYTLSTDYGIESKR